MTIVGSSYLDKYVEEVLPLSTQLMTHYWSIIGANGSTSEEEDFGKIIALYEGASLAILELDPDIHSPLDQSLIIPYSV